MQKREFKTRVLDVVRQIPKGSVLSYGQVAYAAGYPNAARAVGTLMAQNHDVTVPCHRVIRADGHIGEYNAGGQSAKAQRLMNEGVSLNGQRVTQSLIA